MLLLITLAVISAVGFLIAFIIDDKALTSDALQIVQVGCGTLAIICLFAFATSGVIGLLENSSWNCEVRLAELQARREAIIYQMDEGLYLGSSLEDYNSEIIKGRMCNDNPWFNVFAGEYYYKIDPIPVA